MKKIRQFLEYIAILILIFFINLIPRRSALRLGVWLGRIAGRIDKKHRELARKNISLSFAEKNAEEVNDIIRKLYRHIGMSFVEVCQFKKLSKDNISEIVEIENEDFLVKAIAKKKGVIIVVAHFGNWELAGAACALRGFQVNVVAFPQANKFTDRLINQNRRHVGMNVLMTGEAVKPILACLKQNEVIGILADQDALDKGVFVNLLGRPASTAKGPVILAMKTGAPLITAFIVRKADGNHKLIYQSEIKIKKSRDFEEDALINTQLWTDRLSAMIREYPEQWFWLHNRWKSVLMSDGRVIRV